MVEPWFGAGERADFVISGENGEVSEGEIAVDDGDPDLRRKDRDHRDDRARGVIGGEFAPEGIPGRERRVVAVADHSRTREDARVPVQRRLAR